MIIKHIQLYPYQVKKRKEICRYVFFCITYTMLFYLHFWHHKQPYVISYCSSDVDI